MSDAPSGHPCDMKTLRRIFLSGLAVLVPSALTIYAIVWIAKEAEQLFAPQWQKIFPNVEYFPGMGVLGALILVFCAGLLTRSWIVRWFVDYSEKLIQRMPLVKTIYSPLKDMMNFFAEDRDDNINRVVLFEWNGAQVLGFVTRDDICLDQSGEQRIAVYLPMSYQIGGYTLLLPKDRVQEIDMTVEAGMRFAVSAGVASQASNDSQANPEPKAKQPG